MIWRQNRPHLIWSEWRGLTDPPLHWSGERDQEKDRQTDGQEKLNGERGYEM